MLYKVCESSKYIKTTVCL